MSWNESNLNNANFRLRVINVASSTSRDFSLDWAAVKVYTQGGVFNDQAPYEAGGSSLGILEDKGFVTSGGYLYEFDLNNIDSKSTSDGLDMIGCRIELDGYETYSFPEKIDYVDDSRNLGLGFRAKFVGNAFKKIDREWLGSLRSKPYEEAKQALIALPGVGPKIADCVLLFSLEFSQAFPVDVWIKRVMEELYFNSQKTPEKKIAEFAQEYFGKNAGYAQQFLYHYRRLLKPAPQ